MRSYAHGVTLTDSDPPQGNDVTTPPSPSGWRRARVRLRFVFKNLRHRSREYLGWLLARLLGRRQYATHLEAAEVSTVLVCRINGRIGNTLFLTPLIRYLHQLLPQASIDLVLAAPGSAQLLHDLPGVRRIISLPHRQPLRIGRYLAALRSLRACRYDLAIDPTEFSTSARVMLALTRSRYRLGFASPGQWAPLTHAVPLPLQAMHQAVRPVYLPHRLFDAAFDPGAVRLWLPLPASELDAGRRVIAEAIGRTGRAGEAFGFFAHAANLKLIDAAWWVAFWDAFLALQPDAVPVEFLPSPAHAPTDRRGVALHLRSLRELTAAIAATRLFISTDTGPMHLASTTAVPTVALFLASDPGMYGPLKPDDLAIDVARHSPQQVAVACQRLWASAPRGEAPASRDAAAREASMAAREQPVR